MQREKMNQYRDEALAILNEFPESESARPGRTGKIYNRQKILIAVKYD